MDWNSTTFDDASWTSGQAQFGYGDNDEITKVLYGANASNKYITTYFRKSINIVSASACKNLKINILYDDGAVVYINGKEALRVNLNAGTVAYETLANNNPDENTFFSFAIADGFLKNQFFDLSIGRVQ